MKGFRSLAFNGLVIAAGAVLPWAAGIDWTQYVSPSLALVIVAALNVGLRLLTTTPVGTK